MTSIWATWRKQARDAGALHAQGGPDRRREFAEKSHDAAQAYEAGYTEEIADQQRRDEYDNHPLRQISREANRLVETIGGDEPRQLAELVERLADYMLEKEES